MTIIYQFNKNKCEIRYHSNSARFFPYTLKILGLIFYVPSCGLSIYLLQGSVEASLK
jgi:hypothetical protein